MRSTTDIANMALGLLGDLEIANIDEANSTPARLCRKFYPSAVGALSELHDWSFLLKQAKPTLIKELTNQDFTYEYSLPADFLRMVDIRDRTYSYEIVGTSLCTSCKDVVILYVSKQENPNLYSNIFVKAIAFYLASMLAMPLKSDLKTSDYLENKAMAYSRQAIVLDDQSFNRVGLLVNGETQARYFDGLWIGYNQDIEPFDTWGGMNGTY
jgi:hypothetical protein